MNFGAFKNYHDDDDEQFVYTLSEHVHYPLCSSYFRGTAYRKKTEYVHPYMFFAISFGINFKYGTTKMLMDKIENVKS